ncbi:MAG: hypothetical protein AAF543_11580 [Pseudomonadota bacterium]
MRRDDQGKIEVHVANDVQADAAPGDSDAIPLSLSVKLIPIVRLLARQAAREWQEAANDNRDAGEDRLEE